MTFVTSLLASEADPVNLETVASIYVIDSPDIGKWKIVFKHCFYGGLEEFANETDWTFDTETDRERAYQGLSDIIGIKSVDSLPGKRS